MTSGARHQLMKDWHALCQAMYRSMEADEWHRMCDTRRDVNRELNVNGVGEQMAHGRWLKPRG